MRFKASELESIFFLTHKAESSLRTLQKYREEIAKQCYFANGKQLSLELFEELESKDMSEEIERERLSNIQNKVDVQTLKAKLAKKNQLAGGVSDIEFNNLEECIRRSDEKIRCYEIELANMNDNGEKLAKLESFLTTAIRNYREKSLSKEEELEGLNEVITEKRKELQHLERYACKLTSFDCFHVHIVTLDFSLGCQNSSRKRSVQISLTFQGICIPRW